MSEGFAFAVAAIALIVGTCVGSLAGFQDGYDYAARESVKDNPSARWRKALIDAEAERAKEAIR